MIDKDIQDKDNRNIQCIIFSDKFIKFFSIKNCLYLFITETRLVE